MHDGRSEGERFFLCSCPCFSMLLEVADLHTSFLVESGVVRAVDGISFSLSTGEILGLVGESG